MTAPLGATESSDTGSTATFHRPAVGQWRCPPTWGRRWESRPR